MAGATLSSRFLIVDDFLAEADARRLRADIDAHFDSPQEHSPDTHQVWNYWYVPASYTYLRTNPEKVILADHISLFFERLQAWARETLGMWHVSWPFLSLYVDGCAQGLHNDSGNGRFGYVYSLTLNERKTQGGETILLHEGDLFRDRLSAAAAGTDLFDVVEPKFNRLAIFDDRVPHGVQRVDGPMDPREGRFVLHGHISDAGPMAEGPLPVGEIEAAVQQLVSKRLGAEGGADRLHGPLVLRIGVGASGAAEHVHPLVDRVVRSDGASAAALVQNVIEGVKRLRFAACAEGTAATVPIIFGNALPFQKHGAIIAPSPSHAPPAADPDAGARAAAAEAVRARLAEREGLVKVPRETLEMYLAADFLDESECAGLVELIDADRQPSGLLSEHPDEQFRTSESCNLDPKHPLVAQVERKISELTGIDPLLGETIQGQRYAPGQQFKAHHDYFHIDQPYWQEQRTIGGQRTWTLMVFLKEPAAGGETRFPEAKVTIVPRTRSMVLWNNLDPNGAPNPETLHQGMPVVDGVKYVITKWYRERSWG